VNNAGTGILADGPRATMLPSDNTVARNGVGISAVNGGRRHPPDVRAGTPYLGLWGGFYQSAINHGIAQLWAVHFGRDQ